MAGLVRKSLDLRRRLGHLRTAGQAGSGEPRGWSRRPPNFRTKLEIVQACRNPSPRQAAFAKPHVWATSPRGGWSVMDDGEEMEYGPGDFADTAPGHDAWIIGNEPASSSTGRASGTYATR